MPLRRQFARVSQEVSDLRGVGRRLPQRTPLRRELRQVRQAYQDLSYAIGSLRNTNRTRPRIPRRPGRGGHRGPIGPRI